MHAKPRSGQERWRTARLARVGLVAVALLVSATPAAPGPQRASPPWSEEQNNPAADRGYVFQVDEIDNVPDLHGNPADARLVLFIGGNQFMVLPRLVAAFEKIHPELRGRIFYETLPPGILLRQMDHHNTLTLGNLTLRVAPDVYEAGARRLDELAAQGKVRRVVRYATNNLAIMVRQGNPLQIRSLQDLARNDVRLSMPNPEWEGVGRLIEASLRKAGGDELVQAVMVRKPKQGTTFLTHIHHRQTPMRILQGLSDAGVTWQSEVKFQESLGNPLSGVAIAAQHNTTGVYAAGVLREAPHPAAAEAWLAFLQSAAARGIYREFGFGIPDTSPDKGTTTR